MPRPYVVLSCAVSLDGALDDTSDQRLVLSNDEDLDRVDGVRAGCDAILVGAGTVRADNPRLLVRSARRRADRVADGLPPNPAKVVLTGGGDLDPSSAFFTVGEALRLVYVAKPAVDTARRRLDEVATVVDAGDPLDLGGVLDDLARRGMGRLLVEGGAHVHGQFLSADLADELHLVVAPFVVGDAAAPRFVPPGTYPHGPRRPLRLAEASAMGDLVLLRYLREPAGM